MDSIRHVGGPWFEVDTDDGVRKVRGRDQAESLVESDSIDRTVEAEAPNVDGPAAEPACETFSGPAMTLDLTRTPDPSTVTVDGPRGPVVVRVEGRTIVRPDGHFGRGRWTVTYQPA